MTCWIDEVLDGAGMKSHTFMLGMFFVYTSYLGTTYADFIEKIFPETSGKKFQTFHCSKVDAMKSWSFFQDVSGKIFSRKSANKVPRYIQYGETKLTPFI